MYLSNKHKIIALTAVFGLILLHSFVFLPFLHRKEATDVLKEVARYWQTGLYDKASNYWIDPADAPPVYNLKSYKIVSKSFGKKYGRRYASFVVRLEFPEGNALPTNQEWVFEITHTLQYNWKVTKFEML